MIDAHLISADELGPDLKSIWSRIVAGRADLASPFFRPEFIESVSQVRSDVAIAVLMQQGTVAGFWPFQRTRRGLGRPVAGPLSDFQGVIASPDCDFDPVQLLPQLRLSAWQFHRLVTTDRQWQPYVFGMAASPWIDLAPGFQDYYDRQARRHFRTYSDLKRRRKRLEAECGPLRLEWGSTDRANLDVLIRWKRRQYAATRVVDVLGHAWATELLQRLHAIREEGFSAVLSILRAGDRIIAMHFGLRAGTTMHAWFPVYEPAVAKWSPGLQMWLELIRAAADHGIQHFDLGGGAEPFKSKLANRVTELGEGVCATSAVWTAMRRQYFRIHQKLHTHRWKTPLRRVLAPVALAIRNLSFR